MAEPIDFSDLIPGGPKPAAPAKAPGMFDDLIPQLPDVGRHGADWRAAKDEIDKLPESQRNAARKLWADKLVESERQGGGIMQRVDDGVRRAAAAVPGIGAWADEANAAFGAVTGQDYTMRLAYEQAKDRAVNKPGETTHLFTTPQVEIPIPGSDPLTIGGKVEVGDLEKAAGFVGGALRMPQAVIARGAGFMPGAVNAGINGLIYGGVEAAGNAEPGRRIEDGIEGGVKAGIVSAPIGGVLGRIGQRANRPNPPPRSTVDDLESQASTHYDRAATSGMQFTNHALERLHREIRQDVDQWGYLPELHPRLGAALNLLEEWATTGRGNGRPFDIRALDQLRQVAAQAAKSQNGGERELVSRFIDRLDNVIQNPRPHEIYTRAGQTPQDALRSQRTAADEIMRARDHWHRARKVENVERDIQMAIDRAATGGTGGNFNNALRQNLRKTLDQPKRQHGLTPEEIAAYREVVQQNPFRNFLRTVGSYAPTKGALPSFVTGAGAATGNPLLLALGGAGFVAKTASDKLITRDAERLANLLGAPQGAHMFNQWQTLARQAENSPAAFALFKQASRGLAQYIADETNQDPAGLYTDILEAWKERLGSDE